MLVLSAFYFRAARKRVIEEISRRNRPYFRSKYFR
jgi:hypothetical protein